jgi:hypothetical protein
MAVAAVPFQHFGLVCKKGDTLPDDHPLVAKAPHLFVQPDPGPEPDPGRPVRHRGPLVKPPTTKKKRTPKE